MLGGHAFALQRTLGSGDFGNWAIAGFDSHLVKPVSIEVTLAIAASGIDPAEASPAASRTAAGTSKRPRA